VFVAYNAAIWPAQIVAYVMGFLAVSALWLNRVLADRLILSILALMWAWNGIGYHFFFFAEINPAAKAFAALFILQAIFFAACAITTKAPQFSVGPDIRSASGLSLITYALLLYPILGLWAGHGLMAGPMFGVAPCPTTIFTIGMLLLARGRSVVWLATIPVLWSMVGFAAAVQLAIPEDFGLPVAGIALVIAIAVERFRAARVSLRSGGVIDSGGSVFARADSPVAERQVRKVLLVCGIASSLLYVATDILAARRWEGYSSIAQTVSELIAIDAPTRPLVVPLFLTYSVLVIAFGVGVWQSAGRKRALRFAAVGLAGKEVLGLVVTLFFPMHLRGVEVTLTDTMHGVLTMTGVVFMLLAIGFAATAFGTRFRLYSIETFVLLVVGGALAGLDAPRLAANLPTPWMGVWERINIFAYMAWIVVLAIILLRAPLERPSKSAGTVRAFRQ